MNGLKLFAASSSDDFADRRSSGIEVKWLSRRRSHEGRRMVGPRGSANGANGASTTLNYRHAKGRNRRA